MVNEIKENEQTIDKKIKVFIQCTCGSSYQPIKGGKKIHYKSKKHQQLLNIGFDRI